MTGTLRKLLHLFSQPLVAGGAALVIGAAVIGWAYWSTAARPSGAAALATRETLTEAVRLSAAVQAAHETSLAFTASGRIAQINVAVGQHVAAGQTLVALDAGTEDAALASAEATLRMKQAELASLEAGAGPADLAAAEAAAVVAVQGAYVAADDAVHNRADLIFNYPDQSPQLIFANEAGPKETLEQERRGLTTLFRDWQASLATLDNASAATAAATAEAHLRTIETFLDNASMAVAQALPGQASAATLAADKSTIATGRAEVASAASALTSAASALTVKNTPASAPDIAAAQAAVDAAAAAVAAAKAALGGAVLVAPISGTITVQSANPGETVTPGVPLVSMVADGKYQAAGQISAADIAKVKVGEAAEATFDAYPGATFAGHVTTVDPAATMTNGVPAYGVTVTFDADDPRLAAGLPAELAIITAQVPDALTVPASAVITEGSATFVYVVGPAGPVKTPVTVGHTGEDGRVEVTAGLGDGARVLAYGAGQ